MYSRVFRLINRVIPKVLSIAVLASVLLMMAVECPVTAASGVRSQALKQVNADLDVLKNRVDELEKRRSSVGFMVFTFFLSLGGLGIVVVVLMKSSKLSSYISCLEHRSSASYSRLEDKIIGFERASGARNEKDAFTESLRVVIQRISSLEADIGKFEDVAGSIAQQKIVAEQSVLLEQLCEANSELSAITERVRRIEEDIARLQRTSEQSNLIHNQKQSSQAVNFDGTLHTTQGAEVHNYSPDAELWRSVHAEIASMAYYSGIVASDLEISKSCMDVLLDEIYRKLPPSENLVGWRDDLWLNKLDRSLYLVPDFECLRDPSTSQDVRQRFAAIQQSIAAVQKECIEMLATSCGITRIDGDDGVSPLDPHILERDTQHDPVLTDERHKDERFYGIVPGRGGYRYQGNVLRPSYAVVYVFRDGREIVGS